jgi:hypothetical protein
MKVQTTKYSLAHPWEGAQHGNDDENVCYYTGGYDCIVLDRAVAENVNTLEDQPPVISANVSISSSPILGGVERDFLPGT